MDKKKKLILLAVALLGTIAASVSGVFASFFVVGKKIDEAYAHEENSDNE